MKKISGRQDSMLKDPDVATELGSRSVSSVRRGKNEAKRTFKVKVLKAVRNRVLREKRKQERSMFLFLKASLWYVERTGQQVVNRITRLPGSVAL